MRIRDLSHERLAALLAGDGVRARMGPFVFAMRTTLPELVAPIGLLYAHYPLEEQETFIDFEVAVLPRPWPRKGWKRKAEFWIDGQKTFSAFDRKLALPMFEWAINWCVFTRPHQFLVLHAAVLEKNDLAVILPGKPGAGKSTFCTGLSLRGWRLLSDEVCVMRPPGIELIPVPRPIGLKEGSIGVIQRYEPAAVMGPATPGTRKGTVAHLQVDQEAVDKGERIAQPRCIVFPSYQAGAGVQLQPHDKAQTLLRVAQDAFNYSILGTTGFETLSQLVDVCSSHSLTYSDMDGAIARIDQLVVEGA